MNRAPSGKSPGLGAARPEAINTPISCRSVRTLWASSKPLMLPRGISTSVTTASLVRIDGFDDPEAGILQDVDQGHPDESFVLDHENEGALVWRRLWHAG